MEKISRILAPSARTTAAEIADSQPARPGAPALGRPLGKNSLGDRVTLSQKALESKLTGVAPEVQAPLTYKNPAESAKLKMIDKLNQDFFNPKIESRGVQTTASEQALKSMEDSDVVTTPATIRNALPEPLSALE